MEIKLTISDPKTGKSVKRELKESKPLVGMRIGDKFKGETIDLQGYEFEVTGGSDKCGFPMRFGINVPRKRIFAKGGTGLHLKRKGMNKRKTVCGDKINDSTSQVNLKILKMGKENLFAAKEEKSAEAPKEAEKKEEK